jgi:lipopolysaccharide transport system ATP-binding protein
MTKLLEVRHVAKYFKTGNATYNTLSSSILNFSRKNKSQDSSKKLVKALEDISFEMESGEILGLIGRNGAGKSTLLRVIAGITKPSSGSIKINGSVAAILEVGAGFHPEMTGRENARLNGAILGLKTETINNRMEEIVSFADLENFIDTPIKKYSSGMRSRLGFAIASLLEPDLLIVDEALAVGDIAFQQKSLGKMQEMANSGRAVILVSHQPTHVRNLCTRALWIENGYVKRDADVSTTLGEYQEKLLDVNSKQELFDEYSRIFESEKDDLELIDYQFSQKGTELSSAFDISIPLTIKINIKINNAVPGLRVFIDCQDSYGGLVFRTFADENPDFTPEPSVGNYIFELQIPGGFLAQASYILSIEAATHNVRRLLPANHFRLPLTGVGGSRVNPAYSGDSEKGIISPNTKWDVSYNHGNY